MSIRTPVVLIGDSHAVLPAGDTLDPTGLKLSEEEGNMLTVEDDGLNAQLHSDDTDSVTLRGAGTLTSPLTGSVRVSAAAGNLLSEGAQGLGATLNLADSTTARLSGMGIAASPLTMTALRSAGPGNKLLSQADGLFVDPVINGPSVYVSPTAGHTITPGYYQEYDGEQYELAIPNTGVQEFFVDLTTMPASMTNKMYRVRIIMTQVRLNNTRLVFRTPTNTIRRPDGQVVSTDQYYYPFPVLASGMAVIDIFLGTNRLVPFIQEVLPSMTFPLSKRAAITAGSGTNVGSAIVPMTSFPASLVGGRFMVEATLRATSTNPAPRVVGLEINGATVFSKPIAIEAADPYVYTMLPFVAAMTYADGFGVLPSVVARFGGGIGNGTMEIRARISRVPMDTILTIF